MRKLPLYCPAKPMSGLRAMVQPYEDCPNPDVCKKRGCLLAAAEPKPSKTRQRETRP